ncbi:peptidase M29 [Flexivirga caeni]|uniref:peptidase M29 n=1 Tax=Flexivirga caeni TaxID=2294115 RepID=UPI0015E89E39|nr:peptidase M29 [Flexivirga caeni]
MLSESASRADIVESALLAAQSLGAQTFQVVMPTPANPGPVALRSTGTSLALQQNSAAVAALCRADFVVDCTVEGLLHSRELGQILASGTRVLMISNEHPEVFERMHHDPDMVRRVDLGYQMISAASTMRVTSEAGTDLTVRLDGSFRAGSTGVTSGPGSIAHWPGGLVLAFPARNSVNGMIVLAPGDLNCTFKTHVRTPIRLTVRDDYVVDVSGDGFDARQLASYMAAFNDREAYASSHLGWGMNPGARWDYFDLYDKSQHNAVEARAVEGNFMYSTGANETAGRFTRCHFDLPMLDCSVELDGVSIVSDGVLQGDLAPTCSANAGVLGPTTAADEGPAS